MLHFKGGNKQLGRLQQSFQNDKNPANHSYKERMKKLGMFGIRVKLRGIIKTTLNIKSTDMKSIEQSYSVRLQRIKFLEVL